MWVPVNCECVCRRSKDCIKICCRDEGLRRFFSFFLFLSFHPSFLEYKATVVFSSLKDVNKHSVTIYALPNTLVESSCCNHSCQEVMGGGGKAASQPSEQIWRKAGRLRVTLELVLELVSVSLSCRGLFDFFFYHIAPWKKHTTRLGSWRPAFKYLSCLLISDLFVSVSETENSVIKTHLVGLLRESQSHSTSTTQCLAHRTHQKLISTFALQNSEIIFCKIASRPG